MKKKKILLIIMALLLLAASPVALFAERHAERDIALPVIVNNHIVMSDVHTFIKNGRTYVPIRFIDEELGFDVQWNASTREVKMTDGTTKVTLKIGSDAMNVNGTGYTLDAPALVKDDRIFIPLRAVAEAFGKKVTWSDELRAIFIGENPDFNKEYPVIYYYGTSSAVQSDYLVSIAKFTINNGGNPTVFKSNVEMWETIDWDLMYFAKGEQTEYTYTKK